MAAKYFNGLACKRGHISDRYVSNDACVECVTENSVAYKIKRRESNLMNKYGMTLEEYDTMVENQGNVCLICGTDNPSGNNKHGRWPVDHCHSTGIVRGLLCHHCNCGLGHFKDDVKLMAGAINYLNNFNNKEK